ncbi:hypothetical protein NM208_g11822 [Fusarium decemcellulare]|uniref:Uncharacterized protein n=1 Tax=Fusarium decemcellulare TaxID=57161 RepID=A0ACC1RU81_9HYPO|nr:hypothetical protein NM208_g11822 [Fusarium decemcellulare]
MAEDSIISLDYRGRVAVLTIENESKLNSMSLEQYYDLAQKLREIATHDEVFITVILAKGRYFSACTNQLSTEAPMCPSPRKHPQWAPICTGTGSKALSPSTSTSPTPLQLTPRCSSSGSTAPS